MLYTQTILPEHAPREYADRETLWNAVELAEANGRAQLAYSFDFAVPNELSDEENIALIRKFVSENFTSRGMIADMAIHKPGKSPGDIPNLYVLPDNYLLRQFMLKSYKHVVRASMKRNKSRIYVEIVVAL